MRARDTLEHAVCFCEDGEHTRSIRHSQMGSWTAAGAEEYVANQCGGRADWHFVTRTITTTTTPWQADLGHTFPSGNYQPPSLERGDL